MNFMIMVDGEIDLFSEYKTDCSFELMFLATHPDYGQRSIGRVLCEHSIALATELQKGIGSEVLSAELRPDGIARRPKIVTAIFTSQLSQRIGDVLGFVTHYEIDYADVTFHGKPFSLRLLDRPVSVTARLVSLSLN